MFTHRTLAIIKRELRAKLFSKSFVLLTLLIPVLMFGIIGFQTWVMSYDSDKNTVIEIITDSRPLTEALEKEFMNAEYVKSGYYKLFFFTKSSSEFKSYIEQKRDALLKEQISGIILIQEDSLKSKKASFYSRNPNNFPVLQKLRENINKVFLLSYFKDKTLSKEEIDYVRSRVDFSTFRVSSEKKTTEASDGDIAVAMLFSFLLYFSLIFSGTMMMRSVVDEKATKIVDVLLSSINTSELLAGKIIGTAITGVMQMVIWLIPLVVVTSTTAISLPPDLIPSVTLWKIIYFLFNYLLATLTFMGLFATVGSLFDNDQDAQAGIWPVMMLIMIPFFIAMGMQRNPDNDIAVVASLLPFASLIVMPGRITMIDVPLVQFIGSIAVNIVTVMLVMKLAGKIYKVGVISTGVKWNGKNLIRLLKTK